MRCRIKWVPMDSPPARHTTTGRFWRPFLCLHRQMGQWLESLPMRCIAMEYNDRRFRRRLKLKLPLAFDGHSGPAVSGGMFASCRLNASRWMCAEHRSACHRSHRTRKWHRAVDTQLPAPSQEWNSRAARRTKPHPWDKYWNFHVGHAGSPGRTATAAGMRMNADAKGGLK